MDKDIKIAIMKDRLNKLENRGEKNFKAPGVRKKLERQIRNMENR